MIQRRGFEGNGSSAHNLAEEFGIVHLTSSNERGEKSLSRLTWRRGVSAGRGSEQLMYK